MKFHYLPTTDAEWMDKKIEKIFLVQETTKEESLERLFVLRLYKSSSFHSLGIVTRAANSKYQAL